jgi:prepilin-type N-terminal cleavage/methylation domain-containing protein/prepilin-type processing-associated H-X9-DG protein
MPLRLPPNRRNTLHAAFTLTELLVVLLVVAVLASLIFGAVRNALKAARTSQSLANMRQITTALITFTTDNQGMFPSSREPDLSFKYPWDVQLFPYLGIEDGYSGSTVNPKLKPGLNLGLFRCPLDSRKVSPGDANYPRSYGITASTVYMVLPGDNQPFGGGIPGRRRGEGLRLSVISSPSKYVLLCRYGKDWETSGNQVGVQSQSIYNGPDPMNPTLWEQYRPMFGGKTPYAFADGHVALLNQQEALLVSPNTWDVSK